MREIYAFRKSTRSDTDESCGGNVGDCVEIGAFEL